MSVCFLLLNYSHHGHLSHDMMEVRIVILSYLHGGSIRPHIIEREVDLRKNIINLLPSENVTIITIIKILTNTAIITIHDDLDHLGKIRRRKVVSSHEKNSFVVLRHNRDTTVAVTRLKSPTMYF